MKSMKIQLACVRGGKFHEALADAAWLKADSIGDAVIAATGLSESRNTAETNFVRMIMHTLVVFVFQSALQRSVSGWENMVDRASAYYLSQLPKDGAQIVYRAMGDYYPRFTQAFNERSANRTSDKLKRVIQIAYSAVDSIRQAGTVLKRFDQTETATCAELTQLFDDVSEGYDMWLKLNS